MCESNAYFIKDGKEELVMENVNLVKPQGRKTMLKSIFGEELVVEGSLLEMDLSGHRILLEEDDFVTVHDRGFQVSFLSVPLKIFVCA